MPSALQEAVSAIERDDAESVAALIRAGLDVNARYSEPEGFDYSSDETPSLLHWTVGFEALECVQARPLHCRFFRLINGHWSEAPRERRSRRRVHHSVFVHAASRFRPDRFEGDRTGLPLEDRYSFL